MPCIVRSLAVAAALSALPALPLMAQGLPPPQNVLSLSASASTEVPNDTLTVLLSARREGADAQQVQQGLKQALDAALAEARKAARPGQVEVRTGNFALYPRHAPKGGVSGWQGTAELVLEGRDIATIAQLAGKLPTMTVQQMAWSLSKEAREKLEAEVTAQAIGRFRARAAEMSRQFGFAGYTMREVNVSGGDAAPVPMQQRMRAAMVTDAGAPEGVPVEPGKGTVAVSVNGTVQMAPK
jgi:predicted secreted protein